MHYMHICAQCKKVPNLFLLFLHVLCTPKVYKSVAVSNYYGMQIIYTLIPDIVIFS